MFENDSRGRRAARPDTDDSTRFGGPPFRGRGRGGPWDRGPRGGWGGGRGGGRARRGDVRAAILALLTEKPMHGYEMIQELDERTSGAWKPSPGSVYPTLTMLEDEGLVTAVESDGKRRYTLTDAGTEAAAERQGPAPWEQVVTGANRSSGPAPRPSRPRRWRSSPTPAGASTRSSPPRRTDPDVRRRRDRRLRTFTSIPARVSPPRGTLAGPLAGPLR